MAATNLVIVFTSADFSHVDSTTTKYIPFKDFTLTAYGVTPLATTNVTLTSTNSYAVSFSTVVSITVPASGGILTLPAPTSSISSIITSNNTTSKPPATSTPETSTPTTTTTDIVSPTDTSTSFSSGQVAGIAVGSAIAAALVVGLIAWLAIRFCLQRHRPHRSMKRRSPHQRNETILRQVPPRQVLPLDVRLPDPLEDRALEKDMSTLETLIDGHVGSFFSYGPDRKPPAPDDLILSQLHDLLGAESPASPQLIATLLARSKVRSCALRYLLAWTILRNIRVDAPVSRTLLAPEIPSTLRHAAASVPNPTDRLLFSSKWRQLTCELLRSVYAGRQISRSDPRQANIELLAAKLNLAIGTYAANEHEAARLEDLAEIIAFAARFGWTLQTQPTTWETDWKDPHASQRTELVVFPALVQIGDDQGQARSRPLSFGEKKAVFVGSVVA